MCLIALHLQLEQGPSDEADDQDEEGEETDSSEEDPPIKKGKRKAPKQPPTGAKRRSKSRNGFSSFVLTAALFVEIPRVEIGIERELEMELPVKQKELAW
jgi:hypothetical protein